jgi:hypothetical protein
MSTLTPSAPDAWISWGFSGESVPRETATADRPEGAGAVALGVVRYDERGGLGRIGSGRRSRGERAERLRRGRVLQIDDLDVVATIDPRERAVRGHEVGDVTGTSTLAGQTEREAGSERRRARGGDVDDVEDTAIVVLLAIVGDQQRVAAEVDVFVLKVRQRKRPDGRGRLGPVDVEDRQASGPAGGVRIVALEDDACVAAWDVGDEVHVRRRSQRRRARQGVSHERGCGDGDHSDHRQERPAHGYLRFDVPADRSSS